MTDLPASVDAYARRAAPAPVGSGTSVRVGQRGRMRMKQGGRWMPFTATEYFSVERVQFRWEASFAVAPFTRLEVVDGLEGGEGVLVAKLWGRIPVMKSAGADVARAEAMRYLAELFWVPQAILANDELTWHAEDSRSARVTTAAAGEAYGVTFNFDDAGDIVSVRAEGRPRQEGKSSVDTPWRGDVEEYASFGGMRMPSRVRVSWELPDGLFTYWEGEVTSAEVLSA